MMALTLASFDTRKYGIAVNCAPRSRKEQALALPPGSGTACKLERRAGAVGNNASNGPSVGLRIPRDRDEHSRCAGGSVGLERLDLNLDLHVHLEAVLEPVVDAEIGAIDHRRRIGAAHFLL